MAKGMRLDHALFRARLFKSRSKATDACREGRILVDDSPAKASLEISAPVLIKIREKGLYRHVRLLELPGKSVSKDEAKTLWRDETPEEIKEQKELIQLAQRTRGPRREGVRPTKKERRELEKIRRRG